jgi:DNA adenine methylase
VLLRKPRAYAEVYNDLDEEVVNVFQVLRAPRLAEQLRRAVALTAFARREFRGAYQPTTNRVERARRTIVRAFMGFGSASMTRMHITGFRFNTTRSGSTPAQDWHGWPAAIPAFVERLRGVVIEQRPALEVIEKFDNEHALFYCDPPYVQATRSSLRNHNGNRGHYYRCEMDDAAHRALAERLHQARGLVVLSGYHSRLYDELYQSWPRVERRSMADGARERTEVLWLSPRTDEALQAPMVAQG